MSTYEDERGYSRHSNLVSRGKAREQIWEKNRDKYPLPFSEYVVHHKDGDKKNNNIENLQLMTHEEHNKLHREQMRKKGKIKTKKINWVFESRIGKGIIFIIFGLMLIFGKEDVISTKTMGILMVIFSVLFLIFEAELYFKVKKSKRFNEIGNPAHARIAKYFKNNNIAYIYQPKDEPLFDFFLSEYDVYVKYWKEFANKVDRENMKKRAKKFKIKFIEIFYDKIDPLSLLHSSFSRRLLGQVKKR